MMIHTSDGWIRAEDGTVSNRDVDPWELFKSFGDGPRAYALTARKYAADSATCEHPFRFGEVIAGVGYAYVCPRCGDRQTPAEAQASDLRNGNQRP